MVSTTLEKRTFRPLTLIGGLTIVYAILVLGYVAVSPDLRIRSLMTARKFNPDFPPGAEIEVTSGMVSRGAALESGDIVLSIWNHSTRNFVEFNRALRELYHAKLPEGGKINKEADPSKLQFVPGLLEEYESGNRWIRVTFRESESAEIQTTWLLVQPIPFGSLALSVFWFILQIGIFAVGALAYRHRTFDRSARLFFAMCIVTLGAYIGGYHWWVLAGNLTLVVPFVIFATLNPVVMLHFFLVYPRPQNWFTRSSRNWLMVLYGVPVVAVLCFLGTIAVMEWLASQEGTVRQVTEALHWLRNGIFLYIYLAGGCFLLILGVLISNYSRTRNPIERNQLRLILYAALVTVVPVGYSLWLAIWGDRGQFALGETSLPMFFASLCFLVAYAVGMIRHRMLLIDQIISKGMVYYAYSSGLSVLIAVVIVGCSYLTDSMTFKHTPLNLFAWTGILVVGVILLLWLRDRLQMAIDRRFFREKYQLDKALQRMNVAVQHLVNPDAIAQLMLGSCRDVLQMERAGLYFRVSPRGPFQMLAAAGADHLPLSLSVEPELLGQLHEKGCAQKAVITTRNDISPVQQFLRTLQAELIQVLEADDAVVGLVVLGEKRNNNPVTAEDLTFLNAMSQITNVALHSARIHQEVGRLNEELQLKLDKITEQKRQITLLQNELTNSRMETLHPAEASEAFSREPIKGNSPALMRVLDTARKVANSESTILVHGESGTGKELLARVLHENSTRGKGPLVSVHCASLSPMLLESELFGHVKGAFTGAHQNKIGRFQLADGGTLFLDEIGDISLEIQIKLLRVLQERCFEPVGSSETVRVNVRLITATHQDLEQLIKEGRFREDLFYRLNVIALTLPPLRERSDDIFELALHFLNLAAHRTRKRIVQIEDDAMAALQKYHWPGNIRELQNVIERAVVLAEDHRIRLSDLPLEVSQPAPRRLITERPRSPRSDSTTTALETRTSAPPVPQTQWREDNISAEEEMQLLMSALEQCDGNKAQAARLLGMPRSTYFSKLKKHGLL